MISPGALQFVCKTEFLVLLQTFPAILNTPLRQHMWRA